PIPTRDYYALAGIFRSTSCLEHENVSRWTERPLPVDAATERQLHENLAARAALDQQIQEVAARKPNAADHTAAGTTLAKLTSRKKKLIAKAPALPMAMAAGEAARME